MKTFSATDAAISGFGLVREHPKATGAWAIIATIASAALSVGMVVLFGPQLAAITAMSQDASSGQDPTAALQTIAAAGPAVLLSLVYSIAFYAVLLAAIYRAVLRPADSDRFYLRFGADELRQAGVTILMVLLFFAAYMVLVLGAAVVIGILAVIAKPLAAIAAILLIPAALGALIYFAVRLSLASVLTFAKGKIDIFGSMAITKGRFWPMLGAYFVATVLAVVVYFLLILIVTLLGAAFSGFNLETIGNLVQPQVSSLEALLTPTGVLSLAVGGLISVLTSVTLYAPAAYIYREVTSDPEAESAHFA